MTTSLPFCPGNCSGHGHCHSEGYCVCKFDYTGEACDMVNSKYYVAFGTFFFFLCIVSFIQLTWCLWSEYKRQEKKSVVRLLSRMTTQKMLYAIICTASALRGTYYTVILDTESGPLPWMVGLLSAYYPILLTGCSLIVCFWAEEFHLHFSKDRPQFLTKSFIAFIVFNVVLYLLLAAELITTNVLFTDSDYLASIFNGCFAGIMLLVVILFLIYGVEVYFKIHGAFAEKSRHQISSNHQTNKLQLHMSRCGLLAQACLQLLTAVFLISEILRTIWLDKIPVRVIEFIHYNDFIFRIVEFGVALWFPCVLWNCSRPDKLWVLNPRQLLEDFNKNEYKRLISNDGPHTPEYGSLYDHSESENCWICYDPLRRDAGPLISPCLCKGDVATAHHECLRKWLLEYNDVENMHCKVCREKYSIHNYHPSILKGLKTHHWLQTIVIVIFMTALPVAAALFWSFFDNVLMKIAAIGGNLLLEYICLRLLGFSAISAYKRAKMSALKILGNPIHERICDKNMTVHCDSTSECSPSLYSDEHVQEHSVHEVEAIVEVIPKQT